MQPHLDTVATFHSVESGLSYKEGLAVGQSGDTDRMSDRKEEVVQVVPEVHGHRVRGDRTGDISRELGTALHTGIY